jgi:hypothetical protein
MLQHFGARHFIAAHFGVNAQEGLPASIVRPDFVAPEKVRLAEEQTARSATTEIERLTVTDTLRTITDSATRPEQSAQSRTTQGQSKRPSKASGKRTTWH